MIDKELKGDHYSLSIRNDRVLLHLCNKDIGCGDCKLWIIHDDSFQGSCATRDAWDEQIGRVKGLL